MDGFYRFPSFKLCEGERCQRGYSAFKVKPRLSQEHCYADQFRYRHPATLPPDVDSMQGYGLDLSSYEDVKERASEIYARLADGSMPCDEPWHPERLGLFKLWMDEGSARSAP